MTITLDDGYKAMAADEEREAEAQDWSNALAQDMADYYLGHEVLARVRAGQEQTHTADNVRKELGLVD
jgi:predicted DNA-binding protein